MTTTAADTRALQARLLEEIPLARHMEIRVLCSDRRSLLLSAPLAANSNHKGTAFGGSLYSVAVLAGWGLLTLELEARGIDAQIVIQECQVDYLLPVSGDFTARATAPDAAVLERCARTLARYGRARIDVAVAIEHAGSEAVRLRATYVVVRS